MRCIIANVGIVNTPDTPGKTSINDIARKHEAEGIRSVGLADAEVARQRRLAEAGAIAKRIEAPDRLQAEGQTFGNIEKEEKIWIELAKALPQARLKLVSTGEMSSFLDLFRATGGVRLGGMIAALRETDLGPAERLLSLIDRGGTPSTTAS